MHSFAEIMCARCNGVVARFEAHRAGEGAGLLTAQARLLRTGWLGTCERPMAYDHACTVIEAIRQGELVALAREDADLYGFFCRKCACAYCNHCWTMGPPEFDDGFYDCTRATCPHSHEQMVDD